MEFSKVEPCHWNGEIRNCAFLAKDARALTGTQRLLAVVVHGMFLANKEMSFSFLTGA